MGRVVLLDRDQLNAGEEALVQLVMEKPVVAYQGSLRDTLLFPGDHPLAVEW